MMMAMEKESKARKNVVAMAMAWIKEMRERMLVWERTFEWILKMRVGVKEMLEMHGGEVVMWMLGLVELSSRILRT